MVEKKRDEQKISEYLEMLGYTGTGYFTSSTSYIIRGFFIYIFNKIKGWFIKK